MKDSSQTEIVVISNTSPHTDHVSQNLTRGGFDIIIIDKPDVVFTKLLLLSTTPKLFIVIGTEEPNSSQKIVGRIRSIAQFKDIPFLFIHSIEMYSYSQLIENYEEPLDFLKWPDNAELLVLRAKQLVELSATNKLYRQLQREHDKLKRKSEENKSSEMSLAAVNELASALSNQLMGIRSIVDKDDGDISYAKYEEHTNDIRQAVESMTKLLREIESLISAPLINRKPVHMAKLVNLLVHRIIPSLPNGTTLRSRIDNTLWLTKGDYNQLESAISHLVSNAIEAIGNDGVVSIGASNVRMVNSPNRKSSIPEGEYIRISVNDTGTGIVESDQERIFIPLYTTKSSNGPWRGLGLAQVRAISHRHGGYVQVKSFPGKGSQFSFLVPRSREAEKCLQSELIEARESIRAPKQLTLLIVDDEPMVLRSIQSILRREGHRSFSEVYGRSAVDFYRQYTQEIDVVILDIRLLDTTGFDVANEIFSINPDAKIVFTSGAVAAPPLFGEVSISRTTAFLRKPFISEELMRAIHEVLSPNRLSLRNLPTA